MPKKKEMDLEELKEFRIELNKKRSENFKKLKEVNRKITELESKKKGGKKNAT